MLMRMVLMGIVLIATDLRAELWKEGQIHTSKAKVYYKTQGEGPLLFVLNGGPGYGSALIQDVAEAFSPQFKVVVFDQRGTGKSLVATVDTQSINLDLMVEDLEALRLSLGGAKINLLGHSFGGLYAMAYLAKYGQHVKSFVASSSVGPNEEGLAYLYPNILSRLTAAERKQWQAIYQDKTLNAQQKHAKSFAVFGRAYVFGSENVEQVVKLETTPGLFHPQINQLVWQSMSGVDYTPALEKVDTQVLVIQGVQDIVSPITAMKVKSAFKNAELYWLNGRVHYPWLDQPDAYFSAIHAFYRKHSVIPQ